MSLASPSAATSVPDRLARVRAGVGWALVALILYLVHFQEPLPAAPPELDPSWQQGLQYALAHGIHFGSEIVFTFGPLGGPAHHRFQPETFWTQFAWFHVVFLGLVAVRWAIALSQWKRSPTDVAIFVLGLCSFVLGIDAYFMATLVVIGVTHAGGKDVSRRLLVLDALLLAAAGYVKFTYFALGAGVVVLSALAAWRRGWREMALTIGTFVLAYVLVWLACGQRLVDLVLFLSRSAEIAKGYAETQATEGNPENMDRGVRMLVVIAALLVVYVIAHWRERERRIGALLSAAVVAGGTFVAFRASYTFHGERAPTFFAFCSVVCVGLLPAIEAGTVSRVVLGLGRAVVVFLAAHGFTAGFQMPVLGSSLTQGADIVERSCRTLLDVPAKYRTVEEQSRKMSEKFALPRFRAIVGTSTIDALGSSQGWIFLNGLNWKPRPVFQSYSTNTAKLIELNGAFYESSDAPEFVILETGSILDRIALMDDAAAMNVMLARYVPVAQERGLLLMRRDPKAAARVREGFREVARLEVHPKEEIDLSRYEGRLLRVRFDVRYSALGKLRRALLRAPAVLINAIGKDGGPRLRRLVPCEATAGILMRPALEFPEDWVDAYTLGASGAIDRIRVGSPFEWSSYFEETYTAIVERCDDLLPEPDESRRLGLIYGSFPTQPTIAATPSKARYFVLEAGREVVLVGVDARLVFALEPGPRRLTGAIGLLDGSENGDGVDFRIELVHRGGVRETILQRTLNRDSADRSRSPLDLEFTAREGDRLLFSTSNPPGRDQAWDLPTLEAVSIR